NAAAHQKRDGNGSRPDRIAILFLLAMETARREFERGGSVVRELPVSWSMKKVLFLILVMPCVGFAQGGIGVKPRTDLVMLSAIARDSLSDLAYSEILDLKRYAETNNLDSAALLIAYKDSGNLYTHAVNLSNPVERAYASDMLQKIAKLFNVYADMTKRYYTVYKTTETPSGQKHIYQIGHGSGKKQVTKSWVFYPIGGNMLLGSF
ncbi:MAG TPA: hypothetical protein VGM92_04290, partial [Candidatus Kapabacteria bacterium]